MKKHGFTLAEVLVTLGIIGVVAALTTPALIQNVANAKIGPRLQKTKATFETAAEMMLTDESANALRGVATNSAGIGKALQKHMKATQDDNIIVTYKNYNGSATAIPAATFKVRNSRYNLEDGVSIYLQLNSSLAHPLDKYADIPNNQLIGNLYVDINGDDGPNRFGKDVFAFYLYNDGTLRPYGTKGANRTDDSAPLWSAMCNADGVHSQNDAGLYCTGSIFDNGLKVIYQ